MENVNDFKGSMIGDKVYSLINGEGTVSNISIDSKGFTDKLKVDFDLYFSWYLPDGKKDVEDKHPELYRTKPAVQAPTPTPKTICDRVLDFEKLIISEVDEGDDETAHAREDDAMQFFIRNCHKLSKSEVSHCQLIFSRIRQLDFARHCS